jgi:aminoglycoside phosphotransferase (APT) family kinase protein
MEITQLLEGLVDLPALERFLREKLPPRQGEISVEKHEAGYSNETFYVSWGEERWVMRRPPRGDILPTAHDVLREYLVLSALSSTGVRSPRPVIACDDPLVMGAPFYLMERIEGVVMRDELPSQFDALTERRRISQEMVDSLVELHSVDWQSINLAGKPQGFLERQLRRWTGQLDLTLPHTRNLPGIQEVTQWLQRHLPPQSDASVVHGDFKLDNVMFAQDPPARLVAIFDWEMATLGDPLTDLGWFLSYWGPTGDPPEVEPEGSHFITQQEGFLAREEMLALYEEKTGRKMTHFPFYLCLGVWKRAIICEGLYRHYLEGTAANPKAVEFEWRVPQMVERAHRIIAEA